jgi:hypothetical protein
MRVRSVLLVALLAITAAACDQVLDEASLEETLQRQVAEQIGDDTVVVDCPSDVTVEAGGVFTCGVTSADGAVATLEVTQQDEAGDVRWRFVDAATGGEG